MKKGFILIISILSVCSFLMSDVVTQIGTIDNNNGTVEILFETSSDIMGFQFDINGIELTGASGGAAEDAGFTVSTANTDEASIVLGFSLDNLGAVIPAGSNGVLTVLSGTLSDEVCLPFVQNGAWDDTPIYSDADGNNINNTIESGQCTLFNNETNVTFSLLHTYPNPFNPELNIDVAIEQMDVMDVSIYNLNGQHITTIYNGMGFKNQIYNLKWNATNVSSGIYIVRVKTSGAQYSNIVNLLK